MWVLILIVTNSMNSSGGYGVAMHEFHKQEQCEIVKAAAEKTRGFGLSVRAQCVEASHVNY